MPPLARVLRLAAVLALFTAVTGCAIQPARDQDPWQGMNRKVFAFNQKFDTVVARPVARGYVKVTSANVRLLVSNFFDNLQLPISIVNNVLQVRPADAATDTGRFLINSTIGLAGLFDPASQLGLHEDRTDFGVTLARWGVPQGPYLVVPFLGPSSLREFPAYLADTYFLNPMSYWSREHRYRYHAEYLPYALYLVQLRASLLSADQFLNSAYDPYVMMRSAYLQRRNYLIYHGNPPTSLIEGTQGDDGSGSGDDVDVEALLERQHAYDKAQAARHAPAATASAAPAQPASVRPASAATSIPRAVATPAGSASSAMPTPAQATSTAGAGSR